MRRERRRFALSTAKRAASTLRSGCLPCVIPSPTYHRRALIAAATTQHTTTGNILDNAELLTTLEGAKSKAVELADKLELARHTAAEIDEARVRYSPVAVRGAALFFAMAGLSAVNQMYEYSLAAFLGVYTQVRVIGVACGSACACMCALAAGR